MLRLLGHQSTRGFIRCKQLSRRVTRHIHINVPIKSISPTLVDKDQGTLDVDGPLIDMIPAKANKETPSVKLPLIAIGDYVEAFRNGQYSGMVVGQKKTSGELQQLTILLRNGKTFDVKSDSVAFCVKGFASTEQTLRILNEPIDLDNVDANGLLQYIPASCNRAVQHYQRTISMDKGLALRELEQLYTQFTGRSQVSLDELAAYAFKTKKPSPLQRHVTFLHLVSDNTRFIPASDVRGSDMWTLRSQEECERINRVIHSIRTRDQHYTGFLSRMRSLITFYNAHADPVLGTFSQTALEMAPAVTAQVTSTDKVYINFIVDWIRSPNVIVDSPYEVFVPSILKALRCYDDLFFDRPLAIRFLREIGMFKPWDHVGLLENASVTRNFFWSKEAQESDGKMEKFKTAFLSSNSNDDKYASIRRDFGNLPVYTIDDPSAKEIDDGVSIERIPGDPHSVWMHVHIADPTTFISPTHELAQLMSQKAQTLYLPERHFPMLPEELSSKKFSLGSTAFKNKDGSQYAMTFSSRINENGDLLDCKVQPSLVKNVIKVYYDDLDRLLEPIAEAMPKDPLVDLNKTFSHPSSNAFAMNDSRKQQRPSTISEHARDDLVSMYQWANKHTQLRVRKGAILFSKPSPVIETLPEVLELPSTQFSTPQYVSHLPAIRVRLDKSIYSPARQMVAETMIMGGRIVSRFAAETNVPLPFRTQNWNPKATTADLGLRKDLLACREPTRGMVQLKDMVQYMSILPPTTVTTKPGLPHVVMGIEDGYTRATSPLRRYLDMVVHWQLKTRLLGQSKLPFSARHLQALAADIMSQEKQLSLLQQKSIRFWVIQLLERLKSNGFTDAMEWNCIVNMPSRVAMTELGGAMDVATGTLLELGIPGRIEKLRRNVQVGEVVKVRISSLEPLLGRINLELIT
ncbi:MAG: hypothetical protein EXX96DRAFT_530890 [Benjaminiella poitrasii]|nr:MAG: hypothetical protein EXX96DRAFT_530890 [Benjaminiella poitrasii]